MAFHDHQHPAQCHYAMTDDRAAHLLGHEFDSALVTDGCNACNRQTCWIHIQRRCRETLGQIQLTDPPIRVPLAIGFCRKLAEPAADAYAYNMVLYISQCIC